MPAVCTSFVLALAACNGSGSPSYNSEEQDKLDTSPKQIDEQLEDSMSNSASDKTGDESLEEAIVKRRLFWSLEARSVSLIYLYGLDIGLVQKLITVQVKNKFSFRFRTTDVQRSHVFKKTL